MITWILGVLMREKMRHSRNKGFRRCLMIINILNEEIRRYGVVDVVDVVEKAREARLRRYGHVIRRDE
jgi:hypothetical protein